MFLFLLFYFFFCEGRGGGVLGGNLQVFKQRYARTFGFANIKVDSFDIVPICFI